MIDAVTVVAKALYESDVSEGPADRCPWEKITETVTDRYLERAEVAIDTYNKFILSEAKKPGYSVRCAAPVLQDWVLQLPHMQQTVLLTAIRGPDGSPKYGPVKMLLRWYRRCVLLSAMDGKVLSNPFDVNGGSFTGPSMQAPPGDLLDWRPTMDLLVGEYLRLVDALPHHFQLHFMHAAQIVGYRHPNEFIQSWWYRVYIRLVHDMHVHPETMAEMDKRLGDNRADWLARNDVATVD
jgi:hypothetical protein